MARPAQSLVNHLRDAASNIEAGDNYNWGNPARCNCGHLAQCITPLSQGEIYRSAQAHMLDEWSEFANDYCPESGAPMDDIMDIMFEAGLELHDIHELEYLSNREVLNSLPGGFRYLEKGNSEHVALYMNTWADLLEEKVTRRSAAPALMESSV